GTLPLGRCVLPCPAPPVPCCWTAEDADGDAAVPRDGGEAAPPKARRPRRLPGAPGGMLPRGRRLLPCAVPCPAPPCPCCWAADDDEGGEDVPPKEADAVPPAPRAPGGMLPRGRCVLPCSPPCRAPPCSWTADDAEGEDAPNPNPAPPPERHDAAPPALSPPPRAPAGMLPRGRCVFPCCCPAPPCWSANEGEDGARPEGGDAVPPAQDAVPPENAAPSRGAVPPEEVNSVPPNEEEAAPRAPAGTLPRG
ncbi:hypothetical protein T484DRAFT_1970748, partial [Baffinella frigidus]